MTIEIYLLHLSNSELRQFAAYSENLTKPLKHPVKNSGSIIFKVDGTYKYHRVLKCYEEETAVMTQSIKFIVTGFADRILFLTAIFILAAFHLKPPLHFLRNDHIGGGGG